jgi:hypothetical protein
VIATHQRSLIERHNMRQEAYAQSLRVIGQALENLRISAFVLEKQTDKYIVRDWEPSFLRSIADEIWGLGDSCLASRTKESSDLLVYDKADTERLETVGRASRESGLIHGTYEISSGLRVVGDYLDKQRAVAFSVWWSTDSVTVRYDRAAGAPKETNFTLQNLQDLKVGMYRQRSNR